MHGKIDDTRHREGTHPHNAANESIRVVAYEKSAMLRSAILARYKYLFIYTRMYMSIFERNPW